MTTAKRPQAPAPGRFLTRWSVWGLALLIPTVFLSAIGVAATERGTRCITYNECPQVPGALVYGTFLTAVAAGLLALAWPRRRGTKGRAAAVVLQWSAQSLLALVILSYGR
ncbi:hypothetical protein ACWDG1_18175 [Streptomyces sp. NPDC001177]